MNVVNEMAWFDPKEVSSPELTEDEGNLSSNNSIADGENPVAGVDSSSRQTDDDDDCVGYFEGPEKTLEVVFRSDKGVSEGLRALSRQKIDHLCTKAKCTILSQISNSHMDAYVLSESSLFVYRHRLVMKTCGTTTLLRCLGSLLQFADELCMELTWVGYSRKNLQNPSAQLWPHSNFDDEIRYIDTHKQLQNRLRGSGHILGPVTGDHWFVYVADHSITDISNRPPLLGSSPAESAVNKNKSSNDLFNSNKLPISKLPQQISLSVTSTSNGGERTINMMMFDLDPQVARLFYQKNCPTGKEMTQQAGIHTLCPGAQIDEKAFAPCGYSMNAILHDAYFTVHITPQEECSYASFETNTCLDRYSPLVRNVLTVFRPKRFVLTMFGDQTAVDNLAKLPTDVKSISLPLYGTYSRTSVSSTVVETDLCCLMACYRLEAPTAVDSVSSPAARQQQAAIRRERGHSLC